MEQIYEKYYKPIYRYLYGLTKDYELSEELAQETFYSAIKSISNFKNECSIYSWLCQIAKNKWKNYQIKKSKIQTIQYDENIENWLIKDDTENTVQKLDIYRNVEKLDSLTREVVNLRITAGLTFKEIGKILNKTESWARIVFYRAKLNLKQSMDTKNINNKKLGGL